MILVIGNKNYSSWSLRPWIAMKVLGIEFQEKRIPLYGPGAKEEILLESPAGKVPILIDGGDARMGLACHPRIPRREASADVALRSRGARACAGHLRGDALQAFRTCAIT